MQFARWADKKVWHNVFAILREDTDFEEISIDSTAVRAHQHAAGVPEKREQLLYVLEVG